MSRLELTLTWVLKQASPKPRRKLVVRARGVLGSINPVSLVFSPSGASCGKLMNMKAYEMRVRTEPSRRIGWRPHLIVMKPNSPKRRPPTTSPAATIMALMEARAVLFSPYLGKVTMLNYFVIHVCYPTQLCSQSSLSRLQPRGTGLGP